MFLYVLSAPEFLGTHLRLAPTEFFWFFVLTIAGIMAAPGPVAGLPAALRPRRRSATASW